MNTLFTQWMCLYHRCRDSYSSEHPYSVFICRKNRNYQVSNAQRNSHVQKKAWGVRLRWVKLCILKYFATSWLVFFYVKMLDILKIQYFSSIMLIESIPSVLRWVGAGFCTVISLYGSSCKFVFFSLILAALLSFSTCWHLKSWRIGSLTETEKE